MMVINTFLFASNIFENSDFDNDGIPDDMGFIITQITVLYSSEFHNLYFKHETVHAVDASKYLFMFTKYTTSFQDTCLEVLLTAQPFKNNILSVSFVTPYAQLWTIHKVLQGGVCTKGPLNKLIVTHYIDYGDYVPTFISDLALIHELGHAFGSSHDEEVCYGHAMTTKFYYNMDKNHYVFSKCSLSAILNHLKQFSGCFQTWPEKSHCGNGKLYFLSF